MGGQPAHPALLDQILIGVSFWPVMGVFLFLLISGFLAPRHFWLVAGQAPKRHNWFFLFFALFSGFMLVRSLSEGGICTAWSCETIFHADQPAEAWLYWQLFLLHLILVLLTFLGFLMGTVYREDAAQQRARVDAANALRLRYVVQIASAWESSGGGAGFIAALRAHDLYCAYDEEGMFVVVDRSGDVHALNFDTLHETKTAIRDSLSAGLKESGLAVPDIATLRADLAKYPKA